MSNDANWHLSVPAPTKRFELVGGRERNTDATLPLLTNCRDTFSFSNWQTGRSDLHPADEVV